MASLSARDNPSKQQRGHKHPRNNPGAPAWHLGEQNKFNFTKRTNYSSSDSESESSISRDSSLSTESHAGSTTSSLSCSTPTYTHRVPNRHTPFAHHNNTVIERRSNSQGFVVLDESKFCEMFGAALELDANRERFGSIVECYTSGLKTEVSELKSQVEQLKSENKSLKKEQARIKDKLDELDQFSRNLTLRISNCEDIPEESPEDTFVTLVNSLKININPCDIDKIYREGKYHTRKCRVMVVKFSNMKARRRFYKSRTHLSSVGFPEVIVSEDLTPTRSNILYNGREFRRNKIVEDCWSYEGELFLKKAPRSRPTMIPTIKKLEKATGYNAPEPLGNMEKIRRKHRRLASRSRPRNTSDRVNNSIPLHAGNSHPPHIDTGLVIDDRSTLNGGAGASTQGEASNASTPKPHAPKQTPFTPDKQADNGTDLKNTPPHISQTELAESMNKRSSPIILIDNIIEKYNITSPSGRPE